MTSVVTHRRRFTQYSLQQRSARRRAASCAGSGGKAPLAPTSSPSRAAARRCASSSSGSARRSAAARRASLSIDVLTPSGATSVRVPGDAHRWRDGRWHLLAVVQEGDGLRVIVDGKATPTTVAAHLSDGDHPSALWLCDVLAGDRGGTVTLAPPAVGASVGAVTGLSVGELVITAAPPTVSLCAAHYQRAMPRLAVAAPAAYHGPRRRSFRTSMADHPSVATRAQAEAVAAQGCARRRAAGGASSLRTTCHRSERSFAPASAAGRQTTPRVGSCSRWCRWRWTTSVDVATRTRARWRSPRGARRRASIDARAAVVRPSSGGAPPASPPPTGAAPASAERRSPPAKLVAGGKSKPFWETPRGRSAQCASVGGAKRLDARASRDAEAPPGRCAGASSTSVRMRRR